MNAEKKQFYRSLSALVIPITIQNLITNAVNSADVLMLGYVGQTELSAVSLANQFQFLLSGVFFGISSGVTMLASQYWGKKDTDAIQTVMGIAIKIAFVITALLGLGAVTIPETMMRIYTNDEVLIAMGKDYLRIIGISYVLLSVSQVYLCVLRSIERAKLSTLISAAALIVNVVLNATFIFGLFGAPKLGIIGVAVATLIARILEVVLCILDMQKGKSFKVNLKIMFGKNKTLFQDFVKYSMPALINDFAWTLAFSAYSVIMGHLNADVVAANSVASTVRNLCMILGFALGSGAAVLLGIEIGEGRMKDAKRDAAYSCHVTLVTGILTGIAIILLRPLVFSSFELTARAEEYLNIMLFINAYYVIGQCMNTLLISGVFRAGGDSRFGMICDLVVMWGISVPLGFLSAFVFKWPPMVVYFILCLDEFWKIPAVYVHYKKFGWLKDITRTAENG
ncbi:MAG: MATE family efflux transporter [Lachnospiraceae bacterium]|nr:MATE family efflux transporter [Lachnospiraceae bacterium]